MNLKSNTAFKYFMVALITLHFLFSFDAVSQCLTSRRFYDTLIELEKNKDLSKLQRLSRANDLKKDVDHCKLEKDSVYARLLHRIALYNSWAGNLKEAILYTSESIKINTSGKSNVNPKFAVNSYLNLAVYNKELLLFYKVLELCDKTIQASDGLNDPVTLGFVSKARFEKTHIYFQKGDYQKAIEEATLGLITASVIKDTLLTVNLFNERAQSYAYSHLITEASNDVKSAYKLIKEDNFVAYANNYKIRAKINEISKRFVEARSDYIKVIATREKTKDTAALAGDYLDAGILLRDHAISDSAKRNFYYAVAQKYYTKALNYARISDNKVVEAKALNNLGGIDFRNKMFKQSVSKYHEGLKASVPSFVNDDVVMNPSYAQCKDISDKNFLSTVLGNKTESLLHFFKDDNTGRQYLTAAISTALLTDSLITDMRHEQTGELSKLYWRNETREFYSNAIEACYLANDHKTAFYFMEKSRAVLLNDKLNELGAFALLPAKEAAREKELRLNILSLQIKLNKTGPNQQDYNMQQAKLLEAKENLERYIKNLQNNYPAYYQYKYADDVPDIPTLQKYLETGNQTFIHYFNNDSAVYMLVISRLQTKFVKLSKPLLNEELQKFVALCSDNQAFQNDHKSFAFYANSIYDILFRPLNISTKRVIICQDNFFIPFEALTTDTEGRNFLIYNYAFSYVYSVRSLLKQFPDVRSKGDFLGVAPTSYASYLNLNELKRSGFYLKNSAANYSGVTLLVNAEANKRNFINQLPNYTIVNIYSHAEADGTSREPVLFMCDSLLRLSELQVFNNTATKLVVLSACETSVGKNAAGEGILSLARGFALAGIPSITATLWKADENAVYNITESFHTHLAHGMRKEDALQMAKLSFITSGLDGANLPFYWASMILVGNGEPVKLSSSTYIWWIAGGIALFALISLIIYMKRGK